MCLLQKQFDYWGMTCVLETRWGSATSIEAKYVGLLEAIKVAIAKNMQIVLFKLDCKPVVDVTSLSSIPCNELGDIIFPSWSILSSHPKFVLYICSEAIKIVHSIVWFSLLSIKWVSFVFAKQNYKNMW